MDWTAVVIAIVGSGAVTALVNAIIQTAQARAKKKSVEQRALCFLLLGEIRDFGNGLCSSNTIDEDDYRHFEELYQTYKALGGNGFADKLHEAVEKIPLKQ